MAAEILEDFNEPIQAEPTPEVEAPTQEEQDNEDLSLLSDPVETEASNEDEDEDDVPEKYRGKSLVEVARMHQEAEKLIGKQGAEVGELRKAFDNVITGQLQGLQTSSTPEPKATDDDEDVDFFEDPEKAVTRAIERHPSVQQANKVSAEYQKQTALATLRNQHPDMEEILGDAKFHEWKDSTPTRKQLFETANATYNTELASELLSLYKERVSSAQQAVKAEKSVRKTQLQNASTGATTGASNAGSGKRVYRRRDIIKLMKTDPDRYEALSGDIMAAYAEGRVK